MHGNRKHPWETWVDGGTHTIRKGVDYHCATHSMLAQLYNRISQGRAATAESLHVESKTAESITFRYQLFEKVDQ